jgi:hypothetical protein
VEPPLDREGPQRSRARLRAGLLATALALVVAARLAAVFTANVHWDEFALLHHADLTHENGVLEAGGRPGLAVALLLPLVAHCDDEIRVIRRARLVWTLLALALAAGVGVWIAQIGAQRAPRWRDAGLGVALLACVPAFLEASVQVRTDHLALVGGVWGGAALLASRRRPALALAAGALFGVGLLGSQKVLYLLALAGLLGLADLRLVRSLRPARETLRAALAGAGFAAVLLGFRAWVEASFSVPAAAAARRPLTPDFVEQGLSIFDFYRNTIGYGQYREILPGLGAHALLLAGLAIASARTLRADPRTGGGERLALAWIVLLLGLAVALFHAAAFRYFWLTLGVFPAVGLALAREPLLRRLPALRPPVRRFAVAGFWVLLALPAGLELGRLLVDTQVVQRESLAFVHRNFGRDVAGFHPESGLFCQSGHQPIRTHFSQHIHRRFAGAGRERNTERMLRTFRETPIEFIVHSFRLDQFPVELRRFWADNYQPYRASVFVAGRRLEGRRGSDADFELVVPGRYRWLPLHGPQRLAIDGRVLEPGELLHLTPGTYAAHFVEDVPEGLLILALEDPPGPAPLPFYQ